MSDGLLSLNTYTSAPIQVGDMRILLIAHRLRLKLPGIHGAVFTWDRPAYVRVKAGNAEERAIPIVDMTRILQILLPAGAVIGSLLFVASSRRHPQRRAKLSDPFIKEHV